MRNEPSRVRGLVVAGALAAASAPAWGQATYYVRTTGNNGASGTSPGQAWATVAYAVDQVSAGDTIYVGAGTYNEEVTPSGDGTSDDPIVVIADTGGAQTGDAGAVTLSRSGRVIRIDNDDYWTFRGFTITATTSSGDCVDIDSSDGIRFEGCTISGADDIFDISNSTVTISGCVIDDAPDDGIDAAGGSSNTLTVISTTFTNIGDNAISVESGMGFLIDSCRILDGDDGIVVNNADGTIVNTLIADGNMDDGITVANSSSDVFVINCTIWGVDGDGIDAEDGDTTVRNTIFSDIGDNCMEGDSSEFDADTNLFYQYGGSRTSGFNSSNEYTFDPEFADEGGGDFSILSTSGAVDLGLDMSSYTSQDIVGTSRPTGSAFDLGAYEYTDAVIFASVPYIEDFESGADAEWSDRTTTTLSALTQYLGRYSEQDSTTLHVDGMTAGETYYLFFDLYVLDNWEGSGSSQDDLAISIDGLAVFDYTFDNATGSQTYPGTPEQSGTNIGYDSHVDSTYSRIYLSFVADDGTAVIRFESDMTADINNESWGLDDVMVLHEDDAQAYLPIFTNVSSASGFDVYNSAQMQRASGLHWGDLDGDGDMDAVITGESSRVMRFDANAETFAAATIGGGGLWRGGALLDAEGDGDLDFWAGCDNSYYAEGLYTNTWPGAFSYAGGSGVTSPSNNEGVAAADMDNDGWTDLVMFSENGNWVLTNTREDPPRFEASDDPAWGLNPGGTVGNGAFVSSGDVNNDGYTDFFYHYNKGVLLLSDGDGAWARATPAPVADTGNDEKTGSAWGDYDNDGDLDLYIPVYDGGGRLYRNDGGVFVNVAASAGITDSVQQNSAAWGDFDNDWDLDLIIATGDGEPLHLYENQGDGTFQLVDKGAGVGGEAMDVCFVDYDSDGDLDIAVTREDDTNILLRNDTDDAAYLKVRVLRTVGGADIEQAGVRVELWDQAMTSVMARRDIGVARGMGGSEPVWAHFGGVDPGLTYNVRVVWPGGDETVQEVMPGAVSTTFGAVTVPQMLTITGKTGSLRVTRWREVKAVSDD